MDDADGAAIFRERNVGIVDQPAADALAVLERDDVLAGPGAGHVDRDLAAEGDTVDFAARLLQPGRRLCCINKPLTSSKRTWQTLNDCVNLDAYWFDD